MLIKAFLIVDNRTRIDGSLSRQPSALTEVLGHTVLLHVAAHLRRYGITDIEPLSLEDASDLASACLPQLREAAADGIDIGLVIDASHYAEIDWESAIAHHLQHSQRLTSVQTSTGQPARAVIITPALITEQFDTALWTSRALPYCMHPEEYFAALDSPAGLRRLVADALHRVCSLEINGHETRPGIWIAPHARIERGARLVAPVYIGRRSRVRAGAVITRGTSVEQNCLVDCGTAVEDSTLLPFTELGPGLDTRHSVVGEGVVFNIMRAVAVPIADGRIVRLRSRSAVARVLASAASLAAYLPQSVVQSFGKSELPASTPALSAGATADFSVREPMPDRRRVGRFAPGLAVVRRYGNE